MEFESPHPDKHMQQEKGQIEILLLILGIIGVLIFTGFFKSKGNSEVKPAVPSYQKENVAPSPGLKPSEPSPVPVSDGIAPYRFNPAPIEGLPSNTRQTVISLGTNEKAICKYSSISGVSYDAMQYTLSNSADGTLHYASITALNASNGWDPLKSLPFTIQPFKTLDLVTIRPCLFGGKRKRMSRLEICQLGVSLGLQECPQEVGPQLLIQGKASCGYEEVNIASTEPMGNRKDVYLIVGNRGTAGLGCYVEDAKGFDTNTLWAFVKPRK